MDGLSFTTLLSNLVGLFILIGIGFITVRLRIVPPSVVGPLTSLLMKVTLPATIFVSMLRPFDLQFLRDSMEIIVIGLIVFPALALLSRGAARIFRVRPGGQGMWMLCCTFCNNGFMGFPIAYALFGDEGLALAVMFGIPFNIYIYTMGVRMVLRDCAEDAAGQKPSLKQTLFTMVNGATVLGLIFYCAQISVPEAILSPLQNLSNITTPLSMMVTGMKLAQGKAMDALRDRDVITASLVRLLIFPVICCLALKPLPLQNPLVVGVTLVILAMPGPAASTILGEQYHGNSELAARMVFLSSLLCIVTMPLIVLLL